MLRSQISCRSGLNSTPRMRSERKPACQEHGQAFAGAEVHKGEVLVRQLHRRDCLQERRRVRALVMDGKSLAIADTPGVLNFDASGRIDGVARVKLLRRRDLSP